jgi:hypothetical protein
MVAVAQLHKKIIFGLIVTDAIYELRFGDISALEGIEAQGAAVFYRDGLSEGDGRITKGEKYSEGGPACHG